MVRVSEEMMVEANSGKWGRRQTRKLFQWAQRVADVEWTVEQIKYEIDKLEER